MNDAVEFPSHRHPLNLVEEEGEDEEEEENDDEEESRVCGLCGEKVKGSRYECSECNFTVHLGCAKNPPSPVIEKSKIHEHTLTLLPTHVSFTCNACGLSGDKSPYVCLKCSFMVHRDCIGFPRVIKINRHEHSLYHTCFLGTGEWMCGVCRKSINGKYGAYRCCFCKDYAVHSRCATRKDVWDGLDLEGVSEEEDIETEDFVRIDDSLILHFSHKHRLRMEEKKEDGDFVCSGCAHPIISETFYRCDSLCDFILHERCANLPRTRATVLHVHLLTLCTDDRSHLNDLSRCDACDLYFNGFRYRCLECRDDHIEFDVRCLSVPDPFDYHHHPHPLFFNILINENEEAMTCDVCYHMSKYWLTCLECDFKICFSCATLPDKVIYKYDEHPLCDTFGQSDSNPYWCDICEHKIEELRNRYKCDECGPVLHVECALGSFRNMRQGYTFMTQHGNKYEVVLNDRISQLRCSHCDNDCHEPFLLMSTTSIDVSIYLCSSRCFTDYDVSV